MTLNYDGKLFADVKFYPNYLLTFENIKHKLSKLTIQKKN